MPTSVNIQNLKINKLTKAQYDTAVQGGVIGENELSILTDAELEQIQRTSLPTASADELGNIYQFIGTTDSTYTNGYFYKCVSDGATPTPAYSWSRIDVQPGSSLPSQAYQGGKYLKTDGSTLSWGNATENVAGSSSSIVIDKYASSPIGGTGVVAVGGYISTLNQQSGATILGWGGSAANGGVAIGYYAAATAPWAIQLGGGSNNIATNSDTRTFKVSNGNGNYEIMSADGTIPTDRFTTTPVADGTYVPTITISSGTATRSWSAPAGGSTSATATLTVNDWSSNTQTVNVTGVTASNNVIVGPAPASQTDYTAAGIKCTAQGSGTLTFTCTSVPSSAITVNVLII